MKRRITASLAVVVLLSFVGGWARAAELPRYKFTVGQELKYRTPDSGEAPEPKPGERGAPKYTEEYIVVVASQNGDGSWRMLFRKGLSYSGRQRWNDGYFDMAADGRIVNTGTLSVMANPTVLFPPLPASQAEVRAWSVNVPLDETRRECKAAAPPAAGEVERSFVEKHDTIFGPIYLIDEQRDYLFDLEKGLVRKIMSISKQGWPEGRGDEPHKQALELAGSRQLDSAEVAPLKADMDRYFTALAAYEKIMADRDFAHITDSLDQAEAKLNDVKGQLRTPIVQAMLDGQLKVATESRSYHIENAKRFGKLIGQPSDDWKTTDLDDNPRSLEDYRGKVVLLDFWYRGCGWCIRAMPQLKQLADDFSQQKEQVAVLGMNNDRNLDDARLVIDKMGLNYATLKNGEGKDGINTKYGVQGWPTLVVLDGQGVIRHIHVGYSPTLRQELGDKIRELLAEKTAAK